MMVIKVIDFISSGFSAEDAAALIPSIDAAKKANAEFVLDFANVQYFTTLFFSAALTRLIGELGEVEYYRCVKVRNLSESGEETYKHALEYAIEYFKKTPEERENSLSITQSVLEDQ